jgi:hypothetical protein
MGRLMPPGLLERGEGGGVLTLSLQKATEVGVTGNASDLNSVARILPPQE